MNHNCLNCKRENIENYCPNCGQKASVHRYSLNHFMQHDVVHGVWHVDNSLPKTIKQLFTTPGISVREFLEGKRTKLFNFITLLILLLAFSGFLASYSHFKISDIMPLNSKGFMQEMEAFTRNYPKLYMMITIPIYALFSLMWFRKAKLNFSEHLVLNSYYMCGSLIITICFSVISIFYTNLAGLKMIYSYFIMPGAFIYQIWFYFKFFIPYGYSKKGLLWRSIMPFISLMVLSTIVGVIIGIFKLYVLNRPLSN